MDILMVMAIGQTGVMDMMSLYNERVQLRM